MIYKRFITWINLALMAIYTIPVTYSIWVINIFSPFSKLKIYIAQSWVQPWLWASRAKTIVTHAKKYDKNKSYVVISNHLSNLDNFLLFRYLKINWVFMAKKEVYKLPVFRTAVKAFNFIKVDRENFNDIKSITEQAKRIFKNNWSIMIYPQGSRSDKNEIFKFKKGAFHIASEHNIPILPVVIAGTSEIWPKHSSYMNGGEARIHTFEPVYVPKLSKNETDDFIINIENMMHQKYLELCRVE